MMEKGGAVKLSYGTKGIDLGINPEWNCTVIEPNDSASLKDEAEALSAALGDPVNSLPLGKIVKPGDKVGIIFNDITRPTPNKIIIESILKELQDIPYSSITLFNAAGTHRKNTLTELRAMLGDYLTEKFRIVQNDAFDEEQFVYTGTTKRGNRIFLNRELMQCNVKILTGFIEPHFFAGFSGGGKAIMPGMAGISTILGNHSFANLNNPEASWGITKGNPVWEEVRDVAKMAGATFLVNVTLNKSKEITSVYAGEPGSAHLAGIDRVRRSSMVRVSEPSDIVVTTNSGYPLDQNLYQSVKGMSAAARIVKTGGAIVIAAECKDGFPEHGLFRRMLLEYSNPHEIIRTISSEGFSKHDQWQVQILAGLRMKADIYMYTEYLDDAELKIAGIKKCNNIPGIIEQLRMKYGHNASICILPEGPQTIPYLD